MKKLLLTGFALLAITVQAQTWSQQNSNFPAAGAYPLVFTAVDASTVWAMGADGSGGGANVQSYTRTSNGGSSWTGGLINIGNTALLIADISAASATTAWALAVPSTGGSGGGVWKTTNGGTSWTQQTIPGFNTPSAFPNVVHFFDANVGVIMGDPDATSKYELYNTTNGGTTWTRNPAGNSPTMTNEFAYTHMKAMAGTSTIWFGTDLGRVVKSNDKGVTWTITATPIVDFGGVTSPGNNGQMTLKDANTAWVMDQDALVFKTTDSGVNWDLVDALSGTVYSSDLVYVPGTANTLISGGANANGRGSSISVDGGENWVELTPVAGDADGIPTLLAVNPSAIYGGGFSDVVPTVGGMNKLSPLLATANVSAAKSAVSIYPNPTKGQVNVVSKSAVKSILLVDMNGRAVKTFENIKQIDLSGLQKGVYMLNVTLADGQRTSTKLIKE
jgi:hypothetical protein